MDRLREFLRRLLAVLRKRQHEADMADELQQHLEMRSERNLARGMTPDEAARSARRAFGGLEQIKEQARDAREWRGLERFVQDLRYAARILWQRPGFSTMAIASIAIGTSTSIAVFGVFNAVVLRPLPVRDPGTLVLLGWHRTAAAGDPRLGFDAGELDPNELDQASGQPVGRYFSEPAFQRLRTANTPLADLLAVARWSEPTVTIDGQPERIGSGEFVSGNYHAMLGVTAHRGRTLRPEDDRPDAEPAITISYRFWRDRFGADPAIVGRTILLNRTPATIVGVTPRGFVGVTHGPGDVAVPLSLVSRLFPDSKGAARSRLLVASGHGPPRARRHSRTDA